MARPSLPSTGPLGRLATRTQQQQGGDGALGIGLPDPAPALSRDPRYAIRPANADAPSRGQRWDAAAGTFMTGATLTLRAAR